MFIVARKNDVRIRKSVENKALSQNVEELLFKGLSIDFIEVTDFDMKFVAAYHLIYYVSEGTMHLIINDKNTYTLLKGDAVFVEKGMTYRLKGTFKATTINRTASVT